MSRAFSCVPALMLGVLLVLGEDARSQVTVVGQGSTPQGDILRGEGAFLQGLGWYDLNEANAFAKNVETIRKMDQWNREIYNDLRRQYNAQLQEKNYKTQKLYEEAKRKQEERQVKLRTAPTREDVQKGDALNALLTDLSDPSIQESSWRGAKVPLPADLSIKKLIFRFAPKPGAKGDKVLGSGVIALARLDKEGHWPTLLNDPKLTPEREAYEATYRKVRDQCLAGKLGLTTILEMDRSVEALKTKVDAVVPTARNYRTTAKHQVGELASATKMFDADTIDYAQEMIKDTREHEARTVGELLAFMRKYRLVFADSAGSPAGGEMYGQLWELMRKQAEPLDLKPDKAINIYEKLIATEYRKLSATWHVSFQQIEGRIRPKAAYESLRFVIQNDKCTLWNGNLIINEFSRKIYPDKTPMQYDMIVAEGPSKGRTELGIYEWEGEVLRVCWARAGNPRPTNFKSEPGSNNILMIFVRLQH